MTKILALALCNFLGLALFASDYYTGFRGFWAHVDAAVFHFCNGLLEPGSLITQIAAVTNMRVFDAVAFSAMALLYYYYYRNEDEDGRRDMICRGIMMLLAAIAIKQCGRFLPITHPSPSLVFEGITRLSDLTRLPVKDASGNSFPGDHGMMLMLFASFMARYHGRRAFLIACALAVVFSMPRILSGAHWVSDIYAGSLSIVLITASWLLLTPASDYSVKVLRRALPEKLFRLAALRRSEHAN